MTVWTIGLDLPRETVAALAGRLGDDERARADRFTQPDRRRRFVVAHAGLRTVLGDTLGIAPERLRFAQGAYGKPRLAGDAGDRVRFNLSHSHGVAVVAMSWERELGVDVEQLVRRASELAIARHFFTPVEAASLRGLPAAERTSAFYRLWTGKEALLKLAGNGIMAGLPPVDGPASTVQWIQPRPRYVAAVAADAPFALIRAGDPFMTRGVPRRSGTPSSR